MKKVTVKSVVGAVCVTACGLFTGAHAADNTVTINFQGRVLNPTCKLTVEGVANNTIDLGSHAKSLFTGKNVEVGETEFLLRIGECVNPNNDGETFTDGNVLITFEDNGTLNPVTGQVANTRESGVLNHVDGSEAKGVGVAVKYRRPGGAGYADALGADGIEQYTLNEVGLDPDKANDDGKALPMKAALRAVTDKDGIAAGLIKAQMTVTTDYQ